MASRAAERWTFEDYFAWEAKQTVRHEFIGGEVYAMSGGTLRHSLVIVNLIASLRNRLRGRDCRVFQGDAKLFVEAANNSFYPDAFVCCKVDVMQERGVVTDATSIFEVLSPSTALYNRSGKFSDYRKLANLRHYILIDPEALTVEAFELIGGRWTIVDSDGDAIVLDGIGVTLPVAELFEDVGEARPAIGAPNKSATPLQD